MLIDITLKITPEMLQEAKNNQKKELEGHLGTHFDVMDKEFPLEYTKRKGLIFDVTNVENRDICSLDVDLNKVEKDMFVIFYNGFSEKEPYGTPVYYKEHPQLSDELIENLLNKGVSIIGLDFAGIRRPPEHTPKDQYCAERGVFIIENLRNLKTLLNVNNFTVNTYPLNCQGITGLPCRVIVEI